MARVEQMASVLARLAQDMPPLSGVIHAAGVLKRLILQLSPERLRTVSLPNPRRLNLHSLTAGRLLDFVMFSSVAAWLGSPGQSNARRRMHF